MIGPEPDLAAPEYRQVGDLSYLTFPLFEEHRLIHGVFTRCGGTSPSPWMSLNMGATVGDPIENVKENRRRALAGLGRDPASSHDTWLVHGTDVVFADQPRPADTPPQKADILLTDRPEVTLFMRFADCTPILLYDPVHRVIGLAHAGWMGTVRQVGRAAVEAMVGHYHSDPADILAVIGPAICADHYPVGPEVVEQVRGEFGEGADQFIYPSNGQSHFDLWKANRFVLEQAGVPSGRVEVSGVCTACDTGRWYSHRAEHGQTGRFGALMAIP
jgi:YfiH family protein